MKHQLIFIIFADPRNSVQISVEKYQNSVRWAVVLVVAGRMIFAADACRVETLDEQLGAEYHQKHFH
jgi:hypothetical protein